MTIGYAVLMARPDIALGGDFAYSLGYIHWEDQGTCWSGSCYGICSGYPLVWKNT